MAPKEHAYGPPKKSKAERHTDLKERRQKLFEDLEKVEADLQKQRELEESETAALMSQWTPSTKQRHEKVEQHMAGKLKKVAEEEEVAEEIRHHFDYPGEKGLVAMQIGMSMGYCGYVITSWLYVGALRHDLFPDCDAYWQGRFEQTALCEVTVLTFWTFPLFCCIFLLIFFYRDLLCTRLYYECLAHNVFLDFENIDFFNSKAIRIMCVQIIFSLLMYPFTGNVHLQGLKLTVAYWLPILSFLAMLYASWDLETRLLSLGKYVEREFDDAKIHIDNSVFIRDYLMRQAFEIVKTDARKEAKSHRTGKYIRAIVSTAEQLVRESMVDETGSITLQGDAASGKETFFMAFSQSYWVNDFLYCPSLRDKRALKFRRLFLVYKVYTWCLMLFLLYLAFATCVSHLRHQRWIDESILTRWFRVENFLIVSFGPKVEQEAQNFFRYSEQLASRVHFT